MMGKSIENVLKEYREDEESVFNNWFMNNTERLKAFRTIRSGLQIVIREIETYEFGNDFKGSSLETVVTAISEQKEIFEGAAHAFYWKPKLRIPDIYENEANKKAFARFLKMCLQTSNEKQLLEQIFLLDSQKIKGLGPAVANILYFIHPTIFPPFNTAIIKGANLLFNQRLKLGSWGEYLKMRDLILDFNQEHSKLLSKDLGAAGGLLYEIGNGRIITSENYEIALEKIEKDKRKRHNSIQNELLEENTHTEMQYHLATLGKAFGYNVWIAQNDHKRTWDNSALGEFSLTGLNLPHVPSSVKDTIRLIDVLWLNKEGDIISAFEVEKSTSIYSGILRLNDLSKSLLHNDCNFFLVAPDKREKEIKAQLLRPSFHNDHTCSLSYILFSDLRSNCEAMCKFGTDVNTLSKICKTL